MGLITVLCFIASLLVVTAGQEEPSQRQVAELKKIVAALSRQVMLQQLATEEKIRADGGSGLKQIRVLTDGPETYYINSHVGTSVAAIHDHANSKSTLGQGEGQYVLNGVEFRTRHNDYLLRKPSTKSDKYNILEYVSYPPVPEQVLSKTSVQDQIVEMREWFKAWRDQDYSVRDYRPHFKALLCYLEGAWTTSTEKVEEPFFSDRHSLDADTWFDLQEKVRYTAYTGGKSVEENFAYLPTTIINITEAGLPVYAQWNYRILCHPLSEDLPTSYLKPVDDLGSRMARGRTLEQHEQTRAARFKVVGPKDKRFGRWTYLDTLMSEVPGKDNYGAKMTDTSFGMTYLDTQAKNDSALNVGYYHRYYKINKADAMGQRYSRRGFSDPNVFVAETKQPRIAPISLRQCTKSMCYNSLKRMSYAIPLEIVYLTPLSNWNPYNLIQRHGNNERRIVTGSGKRNGGFTPEKAYNGTFYNIYYRIPAEFFNGGEVGKDKADTARGAVGVLDEDGNVRRVSAAGVRIKLPNIPGVGSLRTRYPILPVHGESSSVWKELNALKDVVMKLKSNEKYLLEDLPPEASTSSTKSTSNSNIQAPPQNSLGSDNEITLVTSTATRMPPGEHSHTVDLTSEEVARLKKGELIDVVSSEDNGHAHRLSIKFYDNRYHVISCDDRGMPCWDGHTSCLMTPSEDSCPEETIPLPETERSQHVKSHSSVDTSTPSPDYVLPTILPPAVSTLGIFHPRNPYFRFGDPVFSRFFQRSRQQ